MECGAALLAVQRDGSSHARRRGAALGVRQRIGLAHAYMFGFGTDSL